MRRTGLFLLVVAPFFTKATTAKPAPLPSSTSVEALKKQIAARKGRVVLVNFWATWCTPCVTELPILAKLQKQHAKKLSVMMVSADESGARAQAAQLLVQKGVTGTSWIIAGNQSSFFKKFDPRASEFALPRTYLYGRDGKLIKVLTPDEAGHLETTVARLLE